MELFIKNSGAGKLEAFVECWNPQTQSSETVCEAKLILNPPGGVFIDTIDTKPKHQRKGYATFLVKSLQNKFGKAEPIGITPNAAAFWEKLGLKDALGEEQDE